MFLAAASLAVAAIPEGLPAIVTVTLALGVTRMVKRHALIRRLPAVETLGSTTVICSDKTGTLTKNEMTVTRLSIDGTLFEVTGEGYAPVGEIRRVAPDPSSAIRTPSIQTTESGLRDLLIASVLCNGATLRKTQGMWSVLGDPTEGALLVAAAKMQLFKEPLETEHSFLGEIPFDPERKMMTVVRKTSGKPTAYVKGAPDVLLRACTSYATAEGKIEPLTTHSRERSSLEPMRLPMKRFGS